MTDSIDISQTLRDAENALRDFISSLLSASIGQDWLSKAGVAEERVATWQERQSIEVKKQKSGVTEERIIYYADLYDLKTILHHRWSQDFAPVFGSWKRMEVFLDVLNDLRNPEAHRRELLLHQKYLAAGISGEIRTLIVRYRSKLETSEDYFPRIESARDSLGNLWIPDKGSNGKNTNMILRPRDQIDFVVTARDPKEEDLEYGIGANSKHDAHWQSHGTFSISISNEHVGSTFGVYLMIRSHRDYHAHRSYDDMVVFFYTVLPPAEPVAPF